MRMRILKRDFRLFMRCLLPAAALTMVFAVVCVAATLVTANGAESVYTPVKAAVVDQENSFFSRLVINAVSKMDQISSLMDVSSYGYDEAMERLRTGELAAVIVLPEETVDGILTGKDTRGTIYLSPAAAAHAEVVASAAAFGELMLAAGQYGIFCGEELIWNNGMQSQFHQDFLSKYNARLLGEALDADSAYFTVCVTDYADTNMSTVSYYAVCWLTLLLLLSTMFFSRLYTQDMKKPILCRLRGLGITDWEFLSGKVCLSFAFLVVVMAGVLSGTARFVPLHITVGSFALVVVGVFLVALIGSFTVMASGSGVPILVALSVAGLILNGGVIPRQLLPAEVLSLGSVTPYGAVLGLLMPIFGGELEILPVLAMAVYVVLLPAVVARRITRIRIGGEAV